MASQYRIVSTTFSAGWLTRDDGFIEPLTLGGVKTLLEELLDRYPGMAEARFITAEGDSELQIRVHGSVTHKEGDDK